MTKNQERNKKREANYRMVRLPKQLAERVDRIAAEMLESYESGRGCQDVPLSERGGECFFSLATVIERALDELEDHKARSKRSNKKKTQDTNQDN